LGDSVDSAMERGRKRFVATNLEFVGNLSPAKRATREIKLCPNKTHRQPEEWEMIETCQAHRLMICPAIKDDLWLHRARCRRCHAVKGRGGHSAKPNEVPTGLFACSRSARAHTRPGPV